MTMPLKSQACSRAGAALGNERISAMKMRQLVRLMVSRTAAYAVGSIPGVYHAFDVPGETNMGIVG